MTQIIKYNLPITVEESCDPIDLTDLEEVYIKNKRMNDIKECFPFTEPFLNKVNLLGLHKYVKVDLKIKTYKENEYTCIPGWHCDSTTDALHPNMQEIHHILTCDLAPTEFIDNIIEIPYIKSLELQRTYIEDEKVIAIKPWTWHVYSRLNFHRGPLVKKAGKRFLLRVSETDFRG